MKVDFEVQEDNTADIIAAVKAATEVALERIGLLGEGHAISEITIMGAVDTGRLRNSITHTADSEWAYIGTNVEYAPYVEYGTSKMPARPFLSTAAQAYADEYLAIFEEEISKV